MFHRITLIKKTNIFAINDQIMNDISFPTETLDTIIEILISECTEPKTKYQRFVPRWYLTPLLRVCKLWYSICAKYLYESIAVGSDAPFDFPVEGENRYAWLERRRARISQATQRFRKGHEVAEDLYRTLATNSGLTASIRKLQLGTEIVCDSPKYPGCLPPTIPKPKWTQTNICILRLCPNVEHVEICGFDNSELDGLVDVLKEKSLISFSISTRYLSVARWEEGGSFRRILDMMQKWPRLRSIRVDTFRKGDSAEVLDTSHISGCCPDLREIVITRSVLHASDFTALRAMCSGGVAKLTLMAFGPRGGDGDAAVDALSECLRAWSPTLEYFKLDVLDHGVLVKPLDEALSTLGELRELQMHMKKLEYMSISKLPRLERLACRSFHSEEELNTLSSDLEDMRRFPSINHIILQFGWEFPNKLQSVCRRRSIRLDQNLGGSSLTSDFLL